MEGQEIITTWDGLKQALKEKRERIYISGDLIRKLKEYKSQQLTDLDRLGFELGSGGVLTIAEHVFNLIADHFDQTETKEEHKVRRKIINLYHIKIKKDDLVELSLKMLDY